MVLWEGRSPLPSGWNKRILPSRNFVGGVLIMRSVVPSGTFTLAIRSTFAWTEKFNKRVLYPFFAIEWTEQFYINRRCE